MSKGDDGLDYIGGRRRSGRTYASGQSMDLTMSGASDYLLRGMAAKVPGYVTIRYFQLQKDAHHDCSKQIH